jgi:hypothetical protein
MTPRLPSVACTNSQTSHEAPFYSPTKGVGTIKSNILHYDMRRSHRFCVKIIEDNAKVLVRAQENETGAISRNRGSTIISIMSRMRSNGVLVERGLHQECDNS